MAAAPFLRIRLGMTSPTPTGLYDGFFGALRFADAFFALLAPFLAGALFFADFFAMIGHPPREVGSIFRSWPGRQVKRRVTLPRCCGDADCQGALPRPGRRLRRDARGGGQSSRPDPRSCRETARERPPRHPRDRAGAGGSQVGLSAARYLRPRRAENGALLYRPQSREEVPLAAPPPEQL